MIVSLFSLILRTVLLAGMTFLFVVLFDHGPANYLENVQADFNKLVHFVAATADFKKSPESGA